MLANLPARDRPALTGPRRVPPRVAAGGTPVIPQTSQPPATAGVTWSDRTIELLYLFPAGTVPCIIGVHESQYGDWLTMFINGDGGDWVYTAIE
jgi:hypothetical protein